MKFPSLIRPGNHTIRSACKERGNEQKVKFISSGRIQSKRLPVQSWDVLTLHRWGQ